MTPTPAPGNGSGGFLCPGAKRFGKGKGLPEWAPLTARLARGGPNANNHGNQQKVNYGHH